MTVPNFRVLLASNTFSQVGIVLHLLRSRSAQNLEWFHVSSSGALGNTIREIGPHLLLVQVSLFQSEPYASVRLIHHLFPNIPLILLAKPADKEIAAKCLCLGAYDYMLEGHMDEHTLQRVFQSALTFRPPRPFSALSRDPLVTVPLRESAHAQANAPPLLLGLGGGQFSFCMVLENLAQLQEQLGGDIAIELMDRLIPVLRSVVRSTDRLVHSSPGHFVVVASDANADCLPSLRFRVASAIATWRSTDPGLPPLHLTILPGDHAPAGSAAGDSACGDRIRETHSPRTANAAAGV